MYFQVGLAITCNRGPDAYVGDSGPRLAVDVDADEVNPGQRHTTALELHVGGWRAQLARQLLAVQDPSGNAERATEQTLGQGEVGSGQGITHLGTAHAQAVQFDGLCGFDGKPLVDARMLQEIEIPDAVATKAEVVTDLQMLHAQAINQDAVDELGGAQALQTLVEGQAEDTVHALFCQQLQLVPQAGQAGRRGLGGKVFPRLWLENHHAAGHAQLDRAFAQPSQDSLVATVNTVKVANSGDAAPMLGAQVVETSNQLHNALLAHKVVDYNHTRPRTTGNSAGQMGRIDKTAVLSRQTL
ncbi:hypothetical protein [Pseudomonas sp. 22 E 5]|nr:hypothetical protein [Pseudomonas sp. 22 E 5]